MSLGMQGPYQGMKLGGGNKLGQIPNFTPEMMQLFSSLFSHLGPDSFTSRLAKGDQSTFDQVEAPAMRQFNELQGGIASRFSGMGMGGRRSSGFQNTMNQASSNFAQDLQSRRQEMMRQALRDLMEMSGGLLSQKPYENFVTPKKKSFLQGLMGSAAQGVGQGLGSGFMGLF